MLVVNAKTINIDGEAYLLFEDGTILPKKLKEFGKIPGITSENLADVDDADDDADDADADGDKKQISRRIFELIFKEGEGGVDKQIIIDNLSEVAKKTTIERRLSSLKETGFLETEDDSRYSINTGSIRNKRKGLRTLGNTKISSDELDSSDGTNNAAIRYLKRNGIRDVASNRRAVYAIAKHLTKNNIII